MGQEHMVHIVARHAMSWARAPWPPGRAEPSGLPTRPCRRSPAVDRSGRSTLLQRSLQLLPGVLASVVVALVAQPVAGWLGGLLRALQGAAPDGPSPVSAISVAVVLGMLIANTVGVSGRFVPGLTAAVQRLLKAGIVLVGLKLSVVDVFQVGAVAVPVEARTWAKKVRALT